MSDAAALPRPIAREATRHLFTVDELLAMEAGGAFAGERTQLLDGEIHVLPHDGLPHINYAMKIARAMFEALAGKKHFVGVQTTLHLSPYNAPSPDLYVLSEGPLVKQTPPERILLVIEVADPSLGDDLTDSASQYARHGVQEYWVVDVRNRHTHVHLKPRDGAYSRPVQVPFEQQLKPVRIGELTLRIADLDPQTPLDEAE